MKNKEALLDAIFQKRDELVALAVAEKFDFQNGRILSLSKDLDELINRYINHDES